MVDRGRGRYRLRVEAPLPTRYANRRGRRGLRESGCCSAAKQGENHRYT
jgi:hypothetical protein